MEKLRLRGREDVCLNKFVGQEFLSPRPVVPIQLTIVECLHCVGQALDQVKGWRVVGWKESSLTRCF